MKHVGKRLLAVLLAVVMVLGSVAVVSAESEDSGITLSGSTWWNVDRNDNEYIDHAITGDGSWSYTFTTKELLNGSAALTVEVYDATAGTWISTSSNLDAWGTGTYATSVLGTLTWSEDSVYVVNVTVADGTYTISWYQDGTQLNEITVTDPAFTTDCLYVRARVHIGTFDVSWSGGNTLSGSTWWNVDRNDNEYMDLAITGNGTWVYTFNAEELLNNSAALTVEVYDATAGTWISTSSNLDAWGTGTYTTNVLGTLTWAENSVYNVVITSTDNTYTISWYQDGTQLNEVTVTDPAFTSDYLYVRARVHIGTFAVELTDLNTTDFLGGSLRMDSTDYTETSLRFGYTITIPDGASVDSWSWTWTYDGGIAEKTVTGVNYVDNGDGTWRSNLVITGIPSEYYETEFNAQLTVTYKLADGTLVTVTEPTVQTRTIADVANAIIAEGSGATASEISYANQILAQIP